jgi:hypothetical protein
MYLESYNRNLYVNCLKPTYQGLVDIEKFLHQTEQDFGYKNIENLVELYKTIFDNKLLSAHVLCKLERIHKTLNFFHEEPFSKGNYYWHISITFISEEIKWLDELYGLQLSRLLNLLKHTFSKIDNFYITQKPQQIAKYQNIIDAIKKETQIFLEFVNHRTIISEKEKLNEQQLTNIPFGGLFYTAHIQNIKSILDLGILSHNLAHSLGLVSEDISNQQVNERRNRTVSTLGGNIHDFAPLYFNPRNPMLYVLCKQLIKENLVLIRVNPHILLEKNVCFSDGNAAVSSTQFYNNLDDFNKLNWDVIKNEYWTNYPDGKRIKCSEVLVKSKIPIFYITDIFVYNQNALDKILLLFPNHLGINSYVENKLFF